MKITQIMLAKGFGGAERYFVDLTRALAQAGHQVQAICEHRFYGRDRLLGLENIEVCSVNVLGWWDPLARWHISNAIQRFDPQVVHAHLARAAHIGGRVGRNLNIPVAVKTHNYVDLKYYRDVDLFLPTTQDQKRYLIEHGINGAKVRVVPNFSSLVAVGEAPSCPALNSNWTFGALGRLVKKKGFDLLIDAFDKACYQGLQGQLVIGGDGPDRAQLEAQAARLGCADRIRLCGWVDDVNGFLSGIDVFILPSLDEPFGIVILEAMAYGKAIISTRTQGPLEILDEDDAVLIETGQIQALMEALLEVQSSPALAKQKAASALRKFTEYYSKEKVVPRLIEHYQQLV